MLEVEDMKRALAHDLGERLKNIGTLEGRLACVFDAFRGIKVFTTSLRMEDQAILHALSRNPAGVDVVALDTGKLFPETRDLLDLNHRLYPNVPIRLIPNGSALEELLVRQGGFGARESVEARIECCWGSKVKPLDRVLRTATGWITGLRRDQSVEQSTVPLAEWVVDHGVIKVNVLADWDDRQLAEYIEEERVMVHPLHREGFAPIGCEPSSRALQPGEDARVG